MEKTFVSAESLLRDSLELGRMVVRSGYRPTFLVGMWRGGAPIGIAVQEVLDYHEIPTDHIAIRTSAYYGMDKQEKTVRVHAMDYLVSRLEAEDRLLLVDDVFDSGRSLEAVIAELRRRCRRNRRKTSVPRRCITSPAQSQLAGAGLLRPGSGGVAGFPA